MDIQAGPFQGIASALKSHFRQLGGRGAHQSLDFLRWKSKVAPVVEFDNNDVVIGDVVDVNAVRHSRKPLLAGGDRGFYRRIS